MRGAHGILAGLALALAGASPLAAAAQDTAGTVPAAPPTAASVAGKVVSPVGEKETPVPGLMVTVHRVGPDGAGPLDSVRTSADGSFRVSYRRSGSDEAVYFAAAVYKGIAYFSAPLHAGVTHGDEAEITVFDTTSKRIPFTIQGHHIVVSGPGPDGARKIVEVYELSNDTVVTVIGRDSASAVWSAPIAKGARRFQGGQGDIAPDALALRDGRVQLHASFGPGVKQLSYSYELPERAFPLEYTLEQQTGVLEVLLEEPSAQARSASLRSQGSATTSGRTFKRFLAQGAPAGEKLRIDIASTGLGARASVVTALAVLIVLAMGGAFALAMQRRRPRGAAVAPVVSPAESLIAAIASLDARYEAGELAMSAEEYAAERARLKGDVAAALAATDQPA